MKGLTKRQRQIVDFINQFINTNRYSPSYREIMAHFGFSCIGTVSNHLLALKRKGFVSSEKGCSRSISLENTLVPALPTRAEIELPLIGNLRGGHPIELFANSQSITVPETFVHNRHASYALRVKGSDLEEEMLLDGDVLIIEARHQATPGETVLALINHHETVVKTYDIEGTYLKLSGKSSHQHPIIIQEEYVTIQAVVLGLLRTF